MRKIGYLASGVVVGSTLMIASSAIAGGFSIREQSTTGLGVAFADSAAGSDLSSMYWNPAAVTSQDGMNSLSSFTAIILDTNVDSVVGTDASIDKLGLLAGSYYNYQINQQLYVGLSINAPLGLVTEADPKVWQGQFSNRKSEILTLNAAPTIGYKIAPGFSVAAGLQIEYMKVRLDSATPYPGLASGVVKGDDIGFGFTLGALFEPTSTTKLGIGYRSTIKHKLEGTQHVVGFVTPFGISAKFETPEIVTASIRQEITPDFAIMVNYEWANWSRFEKLAVTRDADGAITTEEPFNWKDSWFVSGGAELRMTDSITGRLGVGYEKSPVPNETRSARLPDSDRIWASFGASYQWSEATTLDFGYSHIFFKDSTINQPARLLVADVENSANIISLGMRHKW